MILKMRNRLITLSLLLTAPLIFTGCETEQDRIIAAAQSCLDYARTPDDAKVCYAKVGDDSSPAAFLVRCSAHFIVQGFTGSRVVKAFEGMKDNASADPTLTLMAFLVFTHPDPAHDENITLDHCNRSGVRSMGRLASIAQIATSTARFAGGTDLSGFDPENPSNDVVNNIKDAIQDAIASGDDTKKVEFGNSILNMQTSFCSTGSSFEKQEICTTLNTSITEAGGDAKTVAEKFFAALQTTP